MFEILAFIFDFQEPFSACPFWGAYFSCFIDKIFFYLSGTVNYGGQLLLKFSLLLFAWFPFPQMPADPWPSIDTYKLGTLIMLIRSLVLIDRAWNLVCLPLRWLQSFSLRNPLPEDL